MWQYSLGPWLDLVWQFSLGPWLDLQCGSAVLGPWLDLHWNMAVQSGTMVRPTVEYGSTVWHPVNQENILHIHG